MKYIYVLFTLLYSLNLSAATIQKEHLFVITGVIINNGNNNKIENFVKMIEKRSGYRLKPYYVKSYQQLSKILKKTPDALAWTCGAPYILDSMAYGQQLIAVPLYRGVPTYSSYIVSNKSNTAKNLKDFKGKVFAYSDPLSNSGYVAPASALKKDSIDIEIFFRLKIYTGLHEKSIEAVYRGLADVGAIDEYIWSEYTKSNPNITKKLHVIQKIGPFAFTPIVAGKDVSKKTIKKIQNALVDMNKEELNTLKRDFDMDGFVIKDISFYDSIKKNVLDIGLSIKEN